METVNRVLIWVISIMLFVIISTQILLPAENSTNLACGISSYEEVQEKGYVVTGGIDVSTKQIVVCDNLESEELSRTIKHELIHRKQIDNGRFYSCNQTIFGYPFGVLLNELEAHTFEWLH